MSAYPPWRICGVVWFVHKADIVSSPSSAKLYEIGAGTSEIRRMVIGRAFNKEYAHLG